MALLRFLSYASKYFKCSVNKTRTASSSSALFIVGDKATDVCVVVNPHIEWHGDVDQVQHNIVRRKVTSGGDVKQLNRLWGFYLDLKHRKEKMDQRLAEISETLKSLQSKASVGAEEEIDKCRKLKSIMKEEMRTVRSSLWSAEEKVVLRVLALPNCLHPCTPDEQPITVSSFGAPPAENTEAVSHIELGTSQDLLKFSNRHMYYLKNDAAIFELCSKYHFSDGLRRAGYVHFSNADFVKSVVVEGCGGDHTDSNCVFILHHTEHSKSTDDLRLHLVGGSSLYSFAAYHTRNIIPAKMLPLRYFTAGRQYNPLSEPPAVGLFQVAQSSVVEIFTLLPDCRETLDQELHTTIRLVSEIYKALGFHFRVCYLPAHSIHSWESLRVSFQMYSNHHKGYVEVGNISVSDDYVSKRLQIVYRKDKSMNFTKVISGTVLQVPRVLACALEYQQPTKFEIPQVLRDQI